MADDAGHEHTASDLLATVEPAAHSAQVIHHLVVMTRERLGLDVAFVSEFGGGQRLFRFVDGDTDGFDIEVDAGDPLEGTYCQQTVNGTIPNLIPDTSADPVTRQLGVTERMGLGAYEGVPVVFSDGRVFGTLCAASPEAHPQLAPRDLEFLRIAAALVAEQLERDTASGERTERGAAVARAALRGEITEHAPIHDHARLRDRLGALRAHGVRSALDDMGTGYAGLSALVELGPDVHKIDRSIIRGVARDRSRRALVAAWVAYAGVAGATVVAEGIETSEELETLRILNVPQGLLLARPAAIGRLQLTPSA